MLVHLHGTHWPLLSIHLFITIPLCATQSYPPLHACRCPSPPLTDEEHIRAWVHVLEAACFMADTGAWTQQAAAA